MQQGVISVHRSKMQQLFTAYLETLDTGFSAAWVRPFAVL